MTRASHQRIAKRAAKFDPPSFRFPPAGMMSEQVDLEPYGLSLGLMHPEGAPLMVAVWDGIGLKRLLPEQATQWADELVSAGQAVPLAPVIEAIRALVRRAIGPSVGDLVRHAHRRHPGEVRAVADGFALVKWPGWRELDRCAYAELAVMRAEGVA